MNIIRGLVGSGIIAVILLFFVRCAGKDAAVTGVGIRSLEHGQAAAAQTAAAMRAQSEAMSGGLPARGKVLGSIAPGETWRQTFTVKLGPESISLDGSSLVGAPLFRDLELRLLANNWQENGVAGQVESVRVEAYSFDIWQLEKNGKLLVPKPRDPSLDAEALGQLGRDEFLRLQWQRDPKLDGFDLEWDLRRGRATAHRAIITVAVTAPAAIAWPAGQAPQKTGDLCFGSQYRHFGLVFNLRHDAKTGGFWISEGSSLGGPLVANPHHARFASAW